VNVAIPENANVVEVGKTYINTRQEVIVITKDRTELCLMRYMGRLEQRRGWIAPISLLVPVMAALLTSDFKAVYGLDAATWHALFILVAGFAAVWLVIAAVRALRSPITISVLLAEFAKEPAAAPTTPIATV
jgi:hypothetical protein